MKKLFHITTMLLGAAVVLGSCAGEEDDIFDSSAAVRLQKSAQKYTEMLQSSEDGWVLQYYPTNAIALTTGQGYLWMLRFNKDLSVNVGTRNIFTNDLYSEATSAWQVISDNGPVLTFNSYNPNVHVFSDPDFSSIPNSSENVWGVGVGGDYEFVIVDAAEDKSYVMLKGKKRGTYNLLTPLPAGTDFEQYLNDVDSIGNMLFPADVPNNRMLCFGGKNYIVTEVSDGYITFYPEGGDEITESEDYPYLIYRYGSDYYLRFRDNVVPQELEKENSIQQLKWDAVNDRFYDPDNADKWMTTELTPEDFFQRNFAKKHAFKVLRNASVDEMSDKMRAAFTAAHDGIKGVNKQYAIDELTLKFDTENSAFWSFKYQTGRTAKPVDFVYTCSLDGDKISFSYLRADQTNGENIKNRVAGISSLIEQTLSTQFTISRYRTAFNLGKMKFTSVSDPDLWFVINY